MNSPIFNNKVRVGVSFDLRFGKTQKFFFSSGVDDVEVGDESKGKFRTLIKIDVHHLPAFLDIPFYNILVLSPQNICNDD